MPTTYECPSCRTRTPHVTGLCSVCGFIGRGREVKPGRPPVTGTTRSTAILVRLEPAERKRLTEAAQAAGLGLGPWLRSLGLAAARGT